MAVEWAIFHGLLAVCAAVLLTIGLYSRARIRFAHAKMIVETVTILITLVIAIAVKAWILFDAAGGNASAVSSVFDAIYKAIGGLTFEGVSPTDEGIIRPIKLAIYYGTSLYAGIVTVYVVSVKASYELYSKLSLDACTKKNIYIITDLNEETLSLAKNIKNNDVNSKIAFAGPRLEAFDRHNDLCQQAMANGFLYWSYLRKSGRSRKRGDFQAIARTYRYYSKGESGNTAVNDAAQDARAEKDTYALTNRLLGQKKKTCDTSIAARVGGIFSFGGKGRLYNNKENFYKRIVIFAFAAENHIPLEAENIKTVCDDIRTRTVKPDKLRIEYVLLTKDNIEYAAYDKMRENLIDEYCAHRIERCKNFPTYAENATEEEKKKTEEARTTVINEFRNEFCNSFVINCWCESEAIGKQAFERLAEYGFAADIAGNCDPLYMWSLGFGSRGKAVTQELYVQSANTGSDGMPRKCLIDVFDSQADRVGGLFKFEHPDFAYVTEEFARDWLPKEWKKIEELLKKLKKNNYIEKGKIYDIVRRVCKKQLESIGLPLAAGAALSTDKKERAAGSSTGVLPRAVYRFHNVSCDDYRFFETIDMETGSDSVKTRDVLAYVNEAIEGYGRSMEVDVGKALGLLKTPCVPKIITVATGDDESNLRIANALIQDVINENAGDKRSELFAEGRGSPKEKQYLIVNITNVSNNERLIKGGGVWDERRKVLDLDSRFYVIVVGNFKDIYTYDNIAGQSKECYYNYIYEEIGSVLGNIRKNVEKAASQEDKNSAYEKELGEFIAKGQAFILRAGKPDKSNAVGEEVVEIIAESSLKDFSDMKKIYDKIRKLNRLTSFERAIVKIIDGSDRVKNKARSTVALLSGKKETEYKIVEKYADLTSLRTILNKIFAEHKSEHVRILESGTDFVGRCLEKYYQGRFYEEALKKYIRGTVWDKRSNQSAAEFDVMLKELYKVQLAEAGSDAPIGRLYAKLSAIEHDRWIRLHLANGWVYGKDKNKASRRHDCLVSYARLDESMVMYDLGNVLWAVCGAKEAPVGTKPPSD